MKDDSHSTSTRRRAGHELLVKELMTRRVTTIQEHESVALAHQMMLWGGTRHLPVVREEMIVGVVSDRDVISIVENKPAHAIPIRDVMSMHVETVPPDMTVTEASARMAALRIDCLPVVKDHKLVGILTSSDVLAERGHLVLKASAGPGHIPVARDVMHRRLLTVTVDTALHDAVEKMVTAEVRHLPVVDAEGRVIGMLSDRDLRAFVGDPREALTTGESPLLATVVEQVMRNAPVLVRDDATLIEIADAFVDERIGAVPVVDADDSLVGIVSYIDVLAYFVGRKL